MANVKDRYEDIQSLLKGASDWGCLFLSICSIAEEVTGKPIDFLYTLKYSREKGWLSKEYDVNDSLAILHWLTGKSVKREVVKEKRILQDNEYLVLKYFNKRTGYTHFRREAFDTLINSVTVREGGVSQYYIYVFN